MFDWRGRLICRGLARARPMLTLPATVLDKAAPLKLGPPEMALVQ